MCTGQRMLAMQPATHLHHRHRHAGAGRLVLALAGDPGLEASQLAAQWADLQERVRVSIVVCWSGPVHTFGARPAAEYALCQQRTWLGGGCNGSNVPSAAWALPSSKFANSLMQALWHARTLRMRQHSPWPSS